MGGGGWVVAPLWAEHQQQFGKMSKVVVRKVDGRKSSGDQS